MLDAQRAANEERERALKEQRDAENRKIIQESLERTRAAETTGQETLQKLDKQGQQMNGIADDLDDTEATLDRTDGILNRMASCWCFAFCRPSPKKAQAADAARQQEATTPRERIRLQRRDGAMATTKETETGTPTGEAGAPDEQDGLNELGASLQRLGGLADDMDGTLDQQNAMAGHLNDRVTQVDGKFVEQNAKMDRLLR